MDKKPLAKLKFWKKPNKKKKEKKKRNRNEYPLKRVLISFAIFATIVTMVGNAATSSFWDDVLAGKAPTSKHDSSQPAFKDETVYIYTDRSGKAESALVDAYLKNNQEMKELRDRTELKNIENNEQRDNLPKDNKDGTVTWNTGGNDVSYEGEGNVKTLPVSVEVNYYLNGKAIKPELARGASGKLKIELRYKSKETAYVEGKKVNVPYFTMTMVTFGNDLTNVKVSSGKVFKTGSSSVAVCTAMPGASSILGPSVKQGFSDVVTITGNANNFDKNQFVTVCNGDALTMIDDEMISNMNMDDVVDWLNEAARKVVVISKKAAYAMHYANNNLVPKIISVTGKMSEKADEVAEKMPKTLKKIRKVAGEVAAKADAAAYTISAVAKEVKKYKKNKSKQSADAKASGINEDFDAADTATEIDEFINGIKDAADTATDSSKAGAGTSNEAADETASGATDENTGDATNETAGDSKDVNDDGDSAKDADNSSNEVEVQKRGLIATLEKNIKDEMVAYKTLKELDSENSACDKLRDSILDQQALLKKLKGSGETGDKKAQSTKDSNGSKGISGKAEALAENSKYTAEQLTEAEDCMKTIDKILNNDNWLIKEIRSGRLAKAIGKKNAKLVKKYVHALKTSDGDYKSVLDVALSTPGKTGKLYKIVDQLLSAKNQNTIVYYSKLIAKAMRKVDETTIDLANMFGVAVNKSDEIAQTMEDLYSDYICELMRLYDTNIRGITGRISLLKQAEEQASVYSGLSEGMDGTSLYMIFTPIGTERNSLTNLL